LSSDFFKEAVADMNQRLIPALKEEQRKGPGIYVDKFLQNLENFTGGKRSDTEKSIKRSQGSGESVDSLEQYMEIYGMGKDVYIKYILGIFKELLTIYDKIKKSKKYCKKEGSKTGKCPPYLCILNGDEECHKKLNPIENFRADALLGKQGAKNLFFEVCDSIHEDKAYFEKFKQTPALVKKRISDILDGILSERKKTGGGMKIKGLGKKYTRKRYTRKKYTRKYSKSKRKKNKSKRRRR